MGTMNIKRQIWATRTLQEFQKITGADDGDAIADLLCDIMHLCKMDAETWGEFEAQLDRAQRNHDGEVHDDE